MDVGVKHNGTTITGFVLSYERVHKVCTGIGTLTIDIARNIGRTFEPWDTIDIYENGSLQVRYYVSAVLDSIPESKLTLDCQDISKRLVDYFIPDSYTIDYPSYTRYWIEKFLDEAGLTYQFTTSSQGNLLSNFTQLGLAPAYEQILTLLQLSGWYMFFDGTGKAVIGVLNADMASVSDNLDKFDILSISKVSDDKMLRNRALVWGAYDPIRNEYAYADVYKPTRWNYDRRDIRTMVVSNSNIPNKSSAYGIANMLVKEFSKITVEKHLTVWGAREINLGTAVRVSTRVWSGKGLVTTFGVTMGKDGLVTNLILDERCPRLFGFFDFGDYVYVGTYGNGVWRKHLKFDPTWYNFSTGLTDLRITDLHINNDVFGAVGASGQMYYTSSSDGNWSPLSVLSLESSFMDEVVSGGAIQWVPFSGIMARATIVDKITNHVKFGVDTWSGLNFGDYFMMQSGWLTTGSGVIASGESTNRGWILEYDPFTGALVGGIGSGIYPVSVSGNYDIQVIDLENDGINDYISVKTGGGTLMPFTATGYNHGKNIFGDATQTFLGISNQSIGDSSNIVSMTSRGQFDLEGETQYLSLLAGITAGLDVSVFDNESIGEREVVWISSESGSRRLRRRKYFEFFDSGLGRNVITSSQLNSPAITGATNSIAIHKLATESYRLFINTSSSTGSPATKSTISISYMDWDTNANTVSAATEIFAFDIVFDTDKIGSSPLHDFTTGTNIKNGKITIIANDINHRGNPNGGGTYTTLTNYIKFYYIELDMASLAYIAQLAYTVNFNTSGGNIGIGNWTLITYGGNTRGRAWGVSSEGAAFAMVIGESNHPTPSSGTDMTNWLISTQNGLNWQTTVIESSTDPTDITTYPNADVVANQLTDDKYMMYWRDSTRNMAYVFNGTTLAIASMSSIPFNYVAANIRMMTGTYDTYYLALNGSTWYFCNPSTFAVESQMTFPANYTVYKPFSTSDSAVPYYYWEALNTDTSKVEILITSTSTVLNRIIPYSSSPSNTIRGYVVGNFFVHLDRHLGTGQNLKITYVNNTSPLNTTTKFLVLQREGSSFNVIQEEAYPIREDISNSAPLLTVGSGDQSFTSHFIYTGERVEITAGASLTPPAGVMDYRYTMLEPSSGVFGYDPTASGVGVGILGLYVNGSGVFADDITAYSGFVQIYAVPSGFGNRIETTNFAMNGQYVFVTVSGDYPMFYQKDPESLAFTSYSGLPQNRATIIRIDDFI